MRIPLLLLTFSLGLSALAHGAILINKTENVVEYLLQENCLQLVESGSAPAKTDNGPSRVEIGKIKAPKEKTDDTIWCLTLTDSQAQEAHIVKLGALGQKCRIVIKDDSTIVVSDACKSPGKETP